MLGPSDFKPVLKRFSREVCVYMLRGGRSSHHYGNAFVKRTASVLRPAHQLLTATTFQPVGQQLAAGPQPATNQPSNWSMAPSAYMHAVPQQTAYQPPPVIPAQPRYHPLLYQSSHPSQSVHQNQPAPSIHPAYQLVPTTPGLSTFQPVPAPLVQYAIQPQYTSYDSPIFQPPRQPVPIPKLPKLLHNESEFTDLKMALDHLLSDHTELSEHYKYRVLMEQLVLDEARLIAQSCRHYAQPYTAAMQALQRQYGQPHQLAQSEIATILNSPDVKPGDTRAFQTFALSVDLLVGMLTSLEGPNLTSGDFEIWQWASNFTSVVAHLPSTAISESMELWLAEKSTDPQERVELSN
ncbi:hypothetical protein F2P81_006459 [Scophthalmus maximus]|uniref:Uncharacterized protein n=1 Tax=Scophthalmus maximus TaxID=52904 RepID=A0A6A4TCB6_SCOMX|nr:hypothetical protein F2P81_006459 [Scophthalmus maximus]